MIATGFGGAAPPAPRAETPSISAGADARLEQRFDGADDPRRPRFLRDDSSQLRNPNQISARGFQSLPERELVPSWVDAAVDPTTGPAALAVSARGECRLAPASIA